MCRQGEKPKAVKKKKKSPSKPLRVDQAIKLKKLKIPKSRSVESLSQPQSKPGLSKAEESKSVDSEDDESLCEEYDSSVDSAGESASYCSASDAQSADSASSDFAIPLRPHFTSHASNQEYREQLVYPRGYNHLSAYQK